MEIYEDIEKKIRKAMREQGTYSKAMEISISLAAGSYMAYLKRYPFHRNKTKNKHLIEFYLSIQI